MIENTVTISTDYEIFLFAGVVILYRPINNEGGPKNSFAYVTIRSKSGPGPLWSFFMSNKNYCLHVFISVFFCLWPYTFFLIAWTNVC